MKDKYLLRLTMKQINDIFMARNVWADSKNDKWLEPFISCFDRLNETVTHIHEEINKQDEESYGDRYQKAIDIMSEHGIEAAKAYLDDEDDDEFPFTGMLF